MVSKHVRDELDYSRNIECTGSETYMLEEDYVQSGHIFYNQLTGHIKFFCIFCTKNCNDLHDYREHLLLHFVKAENDDCSDIIMDEEFLDKSIDEKEILEDEIEANDDGECVDLFELQKLEEDMLVEELDNEEEIAAEVEEEMRKAGIIYEEDPNTSDFYDYINEEELEQQNVPEIQEETNEMVLKKSQKSMAMDNPFSLLKENIEIKKKRVTTVKVIPSKNKVAELLEKIKNEEIKRTHRLRNPNADEADFITIVDNKDSRIGTDEKSGPASNLEQTSITQKIIGDTVITLIPDDNKAAPTAGIQNKTEKEINDKKDSTCIACGVVFRNAFSLAIHRRSHYLETKSSIKLAHKCSDCNKLFNKISEMKKHVEKVHYPDGFICRICNRQLSSLPLLELHMRRIHLTKPFNCKVCGKNFANFESFEMHSACHSNVLSYKCNICGRRYATEANLKQHLSHHKNPVPEICVVCGKVTLRITQHMKIHAPRPKRIYTCKFCSKSFNFSSGLSLHQKNHHSNERIMKRSNFCVSDDEQIDVGENEQPEIINEETHTHLDIINNGAIIEVVETNGVLPVSISANNTKYIMVPNCYDGLEAPPPIAHEETIPAISDHIATEK